MPTRECRLRAGRPYKPSHTGPYHWRPWGKRARAECLTGWARPCKKHGDVTGRITRQRSRADLLLTQSSAASTREELCRRFRVYPRDRQGGIARSSSRDTVISIMKINTRYLMTAFACGVLCSSGLQAAEKKA